MKPARHHLTINPRILRLCCSATGRDVDPRGFQRPVGLCRCCPPPGKPVLVEYDVAALAGRTDFLRMPPPVQGLDSFSALLPVSGWPAEYAADVGHTPVALHQTLSDREGVEVLVKNEGCNPSGSFKDRGLAVGIALGVACGAERFCLPTQGNAGVAASLFSARLGLPPAQVWMPDGYRNGIYHRAAAFFGADVRFAGVNIAATGKRMREELAGPLASGELVDLSTFFEPGRLEGKKTMGLEIFQHFGADRLPDVILYPTGGGTGLVGIWKAFAELRGLGLLGPEHGLPAMIAVQSANCAPVVRSFEAGLRHVEPVTSRGTVADGLDVPGAIMGHGILKAVHESSGTAVAVEDEQISDTFGELGRLGIAVGYESAALVAALRKLRREGRIAAPARVLLLFTANHLIPLGQRTAD